MIFGKMENPKNKKVNIKLINKKNNLKKTLNNQQIFFSLMKIKKKMTIISNNNNFSKSNKLNLKTIFLKHHNFQPVLINSLNKNHLLLKDFLKEIHSSKKVI